MSEYLRPRAGAPGAAAGGAAAPRGGALADGIGAPPTPTRES